MPTANPNMFDQFLVVCWSRTLVCKMLRYRFVWLETTDRNVQPSAPEPRRNRDEEVENYFSIKSNLTLVAMSFIEHIFVFVFFAVQSEKENVDIVYLSSTNFITLLLHRRYVCLF